MSWKSYLTTSIGKKIQMSLTGIFLIVFLIVHCYVNAQIFWNDGGEAFNKAAHFMGTNFLVRTMEIGLFALLLLHVIQGLALYFSNRSKRSSRYAVNARNQTSKWYSRNMALLGTLILLFLIMHLSHFWVPSRITGLEPVIIDGKEYHNLYAEMAHVFTGNLLVLVVYTAGCISLAWHLLHGFYSSLQTLGLATHRYKPLIMFIGTAFSIIVPLIFILMPLAFYLGWIA